MSALSPRLRLVAEGIRDGKSYSEIGSSLGISKQAAHKLAEAAIATLREKLEAMSFQSFADKDTQELFQSETNRRFNAIARVALRKLIQIDTLQP